ncbi:MAG: adenylate/guanylate cyclase domain-containing protein [Sedimentitalea sp.]
MAQPVVQRRLAAIRAVDVVGFSALIEPDETGTRTRFNQVLNTLISPTLKRHNGRIVKEMGDGILAEFASVVDTAHCAISRKHQMSERSDMAFPIGLNLGDVIVEGDDIHGDGVNIAARIEALADPGGIALSRSARDQLRDKRDVTSLDVGEVQGVLSGTRGTLSASVEVVDALHTSTILQFEIAPPDGGAFALQDGIHRL